MGSLKQPREGGGTLIGVLGVLALIIVVLLILNRAMLWSLLTHVWDILLSVLGFFRDVFVTLFEKVRHWVTK